MAMKKIAENWKPLLDHMNFIIAAPKKTFSNNTVTEAINIKEFLLNKFALSTIFFNLDVQYEFKKQSLEFQKKLGSIVGSAKQRTELKMGIEDLKVNLGSHLNSFLKETHCVADVQAAESIMQVDLASQQFHDSCKSLEELESRTVVYKNVIIEDNGLMAQVGKKQSKKFVSLTSEVVKQTPVLQHTTFKNAYLDEILKNINDFLPAGKLDSFSIFDNRDWGSEVPISKLRAESEAKLKDLSTTFGIGYESAIFESWMEVLENIKEEVYPYCYMRRSMPAAFWMNVLNSDSTINPKLQRIILSSIVIPYGSAEAERAFSAMNRIMRKDRTKLNSNTLGLFTKMFF